MINVDAAIEAWSAAPKKNETTKTMEKRLRGEISKLLAKDKSKLNYDTERWKLLSYLRELPLKSFSPAWKSWYFENQPNPRMTEEQMSAFVDSVKNKKIYQMTPKQVDAYLSWVRDEIPSLRERVVHLARKNLGQPYKIYLLGEFPYEVYDADPLYSLKSSDCVVFSEHTYAMALSANWPEFFHNLQKIRYKDGKVGMTTRNHFTEADWNPNNSWLVQDVTDDLGATTVSRYREKIDRARFFRNFGVGQEIEPEWLDDTYIPADAVESVLDKLQDGDFVNVVRGVGDGLWVGHVGLIGHDSDGRVHFIHSTEPEVTEQPIMEYVADNLKKNKKKLKEGKPTFRGFKFLRLRDDKLDPQGIATASEEEPRK